MIHYCFIKGNQKICFFSLNFHFSDKTVQNYMYFKNKNLLMKEVFTRFLKLTLNQILTTYKKKTNHEVNEKLNKRHVVLFSY